MQVFVIGINHNAAPLQVREKLYIDPDRLISALEVFRKHLVTNENIILSTCNRFELYGVVGQINKDRMIDGFAAAQTELQRDASWQEIDLKAHLYFYTEEQAIRHIFRVASSLDSLIVGETQITGQFKDAMLTASRAQAIGPILHRISQEALATAKKVRTQTAIGEKTVSISHAALDLARRVFEDLRQQSFLLIGAGEMGEIAARYINSYHPKKIYIANRTKERANALAATLHQAQVCDLEEIGKHLEQVDVVLSSTSAADYIVTKSMVQKAKQMRKNRPLVLLDIALPRDIEPSCGEFDDVYLFDIDDLQQVVHSNQAERQKAAEEAIQMVDLGCHTVQRWLKTFSIQPTLSQFRSYLEQVVASESEKTFSKEAFRSLDPKQLASIRRLHTAMINRISSQVSRTITLPPEGYSAEYLAEALALVFALIDEPSSGHEVGRETPNEVPGDMPEDTPPEVTPDEMPPEEMPVKGRKV